MSLLGTLETLLARLPEGPTRWTPLQGEGYRNLAKVDHIVVLMMENRSFDHLLGYLKIDGVMPEVEGLEAGMSNEYMGQDYPVKPLAAPALGFNPQHGSGSVAKQLEGGNGGFVSNFAEHNPGADPGLVMGYYRGADLPVYDHLARSYTVCDRWFSSVPGATWPNRLYSIAGAAPSLDDQAVPLYAKRSFVRQLDKHPELGEARWGWYSYDPATLRLIDPRYRLRHHENFAYVDRRAAQLASSWQGRLFQWAVKEVDEALDEDECFLDHCAAPEKLPNVCWIDPNFNDPNAFAHPSNDDHPPTSIRSGQELVLMVYRALIADPEVWNKTLLVITYDEHGGLYDHVSPPADAPHRDRRFARFGVRVPALVVSPWVEHGACKTQFDHTSIMKTILARFRERDGKVPDLGPRMRAAEDLGQVLGANEPRPAPPLEPTIEAVEAWQAETPAIPLGPYSGPRPPQQLDSFKSGLVHASRYLRRRGLPAGHP